MSPRSLKGNSKPQVLKMQHPAPQNPPNLNISTEDVYTDDGIDRKDTPLVGRSFELEYNNKKGGGHHANPRHKRPFNSPEERFHADVIKR